jgi:hypothetical protein
VFRYRTNGITVRVIDLRGVIRRKLALAWLYCFEVRGSLGRWFWEFFTTRTANGPAGLIMKYDEVKLVAHAAESPKYLKS